MKKDTAAYLAMAVFGVAAVCIMVMGVVMDRTTLGLMGLVFAIYPMMIGVGTSVKRDLRQDIEELKAEMKALRRSLSSEE